MAVCDYAKIFFGRKLIDIPQPQIALITEVDYVDLKQVVLFGESLASSSLFHHGR